MRQQLKAGWSLVPVSNHVAQRYRLKTSAWSPDDLGVSVILRSQIWLETPLSPDWIVAYRLAVDRQAERVVVSEVRIFPNEENRASGGSWSGEYRDFDQAIPEKGLTSSIVHRVRLGNDVHAFKPIVEQLRKTDSKFTEYFGLTSHTTAHDGRRGSRKASGRGRPSLPLVDYADIAKRYADAVRAGSRTPLQDVRSQLELASTSVVRNRVARARTLGLLDKGTGHGRPGGKLTQKARRLLR